jgi:hypothetical protein
VCHPLILPDHSQHHYHLEDSNNIPEPQQLVGKVLCIKLNRWLVPKCEAYILSTPIFCNNYFKQVEGSEYIKPINAIDSAEAIAVLFGMLEINEVRDPTYIEWGDRDRFLEE